jgi:hypothetical protein
MDRDKFIQAIDNHLEDIREQFEVIRDYQGKIPAIELDLIMSNVRKVYETLLKLEKLNPPAIPLNVQEPEAVKTESPAEEAPTEIKEENLDKEKDTADLTVGQNEPEKVAPPVKKDPEQEVKPQIQETEPANVPLAKTTIIEEVVVEAPPPAETQQDDGMTGATEKEPVPEQPKTTLDLFGEQTTTLADSLKDKPEKRVADKLQGEKVNDIKSTIGINEKFSFINELFDGSLKNYEEALAKLNQCHSGEEAGRVLDELLESYSWEKENTTALSFIELVHRKF